MYSSDIKNCYEKNESFWEFKGSLESVDNWPMMSTPFPMLTIFTTYLLYVLKIGPTQMKNKQAYNLQNVLVLYNAVQVFVSAYIVYLSCPLLWQYGWVSRTCLLETKDTRDKLTTIMYYYHLAKISEVFDTIFFVLRKKNNQITFLHVYHHAVMIVLSWFILKYEPTYPTLFIRNINSFVHVIMYTYYGLAAFPGLTKYLWWKKYITTLQLVQFTLVLIHFTLTCLISECKPSFSLSFTVFWNTLLFLVLFTKFYFETYKKPKSTKTERTVTNTKSFEMDYTKINSVNCKTFRKKVLNGS